MNVEQFRDNDRGYLTWTSAHPEGYVINIQRSLNPADARLHRADCRTINGQPARGRTWTEGLYIKVCSVSAPNLLDWASAHARSGIPRCRACTPTI